MIEIIFLVLGIVWLMMGATGTTGFKKIPVAHDAMQAWMFVFGILHLVAVLVLLGNVVPNNYLLNTTTSTTFTNFTTADFNNLGVLQNTHTVVQPTSSTTNYIYDTGGNAIATAYMYFYILTACIYIVAFMASLVKGQLEGIDKKVSK